MGWSTTTLRRCSECHCRVGYEDKFCSKCGGATEDHRPTPYAETRPTKGVYEITIKIRREFDSKDEADEAAYKSTIYEDTRVGDCEGVDGAAPYSVRFVESTVTPETHPFECGHCKEKSGNAYERKYPTVAESEDYRCASCENQQWVRRGVESANA